MVCALTLSFTLGFADHVRSRLGARGSGAVQGGAMRCTECQAFCCEAVGIDKWRHWVAAALVVETTVATAAAIGARGLRPQFRPGHADGNAAARHRRAGRREVAALVRTDITVRLSLLLSPRSTPFSPGELPSVRKRSRCWRFFVCKICEVVCAATLRNPLCIMCTSLFLIPARSL